MVMGKVGPNALICCDSFVLRLVSGKFLDSCEISHDVEDFLGMNPEQ